MQEPQLAGLVVQICGQAGIRHGTCLHHYAGNGIGPCFEMGLEKIIPMTAFGTPFKVEILPHKQWSLK
jgi:hypothetical protein